MRHINSFRGCLVVVLYFFLFQKNCTIFNNLLYFNCKFETFNDGCPGSKIEEGRSEMRYALRIVEVRELIDFRTRIAASEKKLRHILLSEIFTLPFHI